MYETLKAMGKKRAVTRMIISLVVAAGILIFTKFGAIQLLTGPKQLDLTKDLASQAGQYVEYDANMIVGEYVRVVSQNTSTRQETLKSIGYLAYDYDTDLIFGIFSPAGQRRPLDQLMDATDSYWDGGGFPDGLKVTGALIPIPSDEMSYFNSSVGDLTGMEDYIFPYTIKTGHMPVLIGTSMTTGLVAVLSVGAVFLILLAISYLFTMNSNKAVKNIENFISQNPGITQEMIEADFLTAEQITKQVWVGRRFTIYMGGLTANIINNADQVWGYYYQRTGRYAVSQAWLYDKNKKCTMINVSQADANRILENFVVNQPHVVIGYSKELEKLFKKEFDQFLALKYNVPEQSQEPNYGYGETEQQNL